MTLTQREPRVLDPSSTALVVVHLQNVTMAMTTAPHTAQDVLANSLRLADRCRTHGALVVLIRVSVGVRGAMQLRPQIDAPFPAFKVPERWDEFPPELGPRDFDVVVTSFNWGGFFATDLDQQLRRRAIKTLLIGGIATNFGVESTARQAHEAGYELVLVEDAMGGFEADEHRFAVERIFPRIGRVRSTREVLEALT